MVVLLQRLQSLRPWNIYCTFVSLQLDVMIVPDHVHRVECAACSAKDCRSFLVVVDHLGPLSSQDSIFSLGQPETQQ